MPSRRWSGTLSRELTHWAREGLITSAQREQIEQRYSGQNAQHRLISAVLILGAILVGLGVLLFLSSNWSALSRPLKLGIMAVALVGFETTGFYFASYPGRSPRLGEALLLVGAMVFGANLWLIAQIFQFPYNHAESVLAWLLGVLPLAWLTRSWTVTLLSSILAPLWLIVSMARLERWSFFGNSATSDLPILWLFLLLAAAAGALAYRHRQRTALGVTLIGVAIWLGHFLWVQIESMSASRAGLTSNSLNDAILYASLYSAYGLCLYAASVRHRDWADLERFSGVYAHFGLLILFLSNYPLTFASVFDQYQAPLVIPAGAYLLFAGFVGAALLAARRSTDAANRLEARLVLGMVLGQVLMMWLGWWGSGPLALGYNALLVAELLGFLYIGYVRQAEGLFHLSLYGLGLVIFGRYVDTFWDLLPRSLFFLVAGILMLSWGIWIERTRKTTREQWRRQA